VKQTQMKAILKTISITALFASTAILPALAQQDAGKTDSISLTIDAKAAGKPFPHFWEQTMGSGRAILSLRESYRNDLRAVKKATGLPSIRFHGIFMDEVGLFNIDDKGKVYYNFSYIDQIYDGLLENGVRPFVELGFMPKQMTSDANALHAFWYKQNVAPPKDYALWDNMITAFTQHLIARYGIEEVSQWNFEVWNEPNIDFWVGKPAQSTYFELYDHTARALKAVSPRIRVGGPATAQAAWASDFLAHAKQANIAVDFVSTHVYANDTAKDVFKTDENIPRDRMVCRSVAKVHEEIARSPFPNTPLIFSEYNASYANEPNVTDTTYMGPWLAGTISQCDGLTESMSYWSFSDVFEEQGVVKTPFYGGFGLIAADSIPKPVFSAFAMLHRLGDTRMKLDSDSALATRKADGTLAIALWNYVAPYGTGPSYTAPPSNPGPKKKFVVKIKGVAADAAVTLWRVDADHGNALKLFDSMGQPAFPSQKQIDELRKAGMPASAETTHLVNGELAITIPAQGLVVVEVR